jgi:putative peptidoglycan lipid II flippase
MISRAFYALKNTKTPMYASILSILASIILAYLLPELAKLPVLQGIENLRQIMTGVAGLALAFSIGSFINIYLLFHFLRKKYPEIYNQEVIFSVLKTLLISIIMGYIMWLTAHVMVRFVDMARFVGVFIQSGVTFVVGAAIFVLLSYFFKCDELRWALTRKISGTTNQN